MAATKCIVICHSDFTQHTMVAAFWKTVLESRSAKLSCHALRLSEGTMVLCDSSFTQHTMMASYLDNVLLSLRQSWNPGLPNCHFMHWGCLKEPIDYFIFWTGFGKNSWLWNFFFLLDTLEGIAGTAAWPVVSLGVEGDQRNQINGMQDA